MLDLDRVKEYSLQYISHKEGGWYAYKERCKKIAREQGTTAKNVMMHLHSPSMDELPTHFQTRVGNIKGAIMKFPQADQDIYVSCNATDWCDFLVSRGYLCKTHNPFTSDLQVIDIQRTDKNLKDALKIKVWIT